MKILLIIILCFTPILFPLIISELVPDIGGTGLFLSILISLIFSIVSFNAVVDGGWEKAFKSFFSLESVNGLLKFIGGFIAICLLLYLIDGTKKKSNEITSCEIVTNIIGRDYVEFHSNSVIINIPYPKIGISSTYGIDYPDDFNFTEIEKEIFNELRTNKYNGNIQIKACFLTIDKYGYEQKENPIVLGYINANEIKRYKNFSSYRPQISNWVNDHLRN